MTIILSISFLIQLVYWYRVYGNLLKSGPVTKEWNQKAVSIIICVKDGINDLKENIHSFLEQNHPQFKIIIANDHSLDGSAEFLKKIDSERRTLTVYEVKQNKHGKKQALSEAIVVSQTNWVLLSDVDCKPRSQDWVQSMANCANASNIKVVLGYSPITSDKSLVSKWSHFESWLTGLQYLSLAKIGWPYMGVGRNLMYDKRVLKPDTYEKYDYLASGDDDLTIMQIATAENTAVNLDPDSFVDSKPQ